MNNKKKFVSLLLIMTMLVTALAGCIKGEANDTDGSSELTPTQAPAEDPTPTITPEPTTVPTPDPIDYTNAVIKDVYADYFSVGAVLNNNIINLDIVQDMITTHFNSFTLENEMKPDFMLDRQASTSDAMFDESPVVNFTNAIPGLKFAKENGIKMRGHTLVWHSQTPRWLFAEGYSNAADAPLVSRELMLKRMENYIRQILEYTQKNYPGVIYAWDVVNEAIEIGNGHPDGIRTENNLWYEVVGDDFIEKAFEYARKYADPEVKLFYNDYGTDNVLKAAAIKKLCQKIQGQGNIDGIGMQTHVGLTSPSISDIDKTTRSLGELGLELQVTELDVGMTSNTEEDLANQATRYRRLFMFFQKWVDDGIKLTNVTLWGTTDNRSWLNKPDVPNYPLLFDKDFEKKPAYYGAIQDPEVPIY